MCSLLHKIQILDKPLVSKEIADFIISPAAIVGKSSIPFYHSLSQRLLPFLSPCAWYRLFGAYLYNPRVRPFFFCNTSDSALIEHRCVAILSSSVLLSTGLGETFFPLPIRRKSPLI